MTTIPYPGGRGPRLPTQWAVAGLGALAFAAGGLALGAASWKHGLLFAVGGLLGVSLYHAALGFTGAYRRAIVHRELTGVHAQLIMLGAASLLFAPILAAGQVFGHGVTGAVAPLGWQLAVGSFVFGVGMQLGGGLRLGHPVHPGGRQCAHAGDPARLLRGCILGQPAPGLVGHTAPAGPGGAGPGTGLGGRRAAAIRSAGPDLPGLAALGA